MKKFLESAVAYVVVGAIMGGGVLLVAAIVNGLDVHGHVAPYVHAAAASIAR